MSGYLVVPSARLPVLAGLAGVAVLAGCNPQSAKLEDAKFRAFFSASTSPTFLNDQLGLNSDAAFVENETEKFTPETPYESNGLQHYQIDCRADIPEEDLLPQSGANYPICNDALWPFENEIWAGFDGYDVVAGALEPWRGEAVMTSEHDLQMTFHQELPGKGDFRFTWVVDPSFAPSECRLDENGQSVRSPIDGDWLAEWAKDIPAESGAKTRFYLNAGGYQFDPDHITDTSPTIWILPDKWLAGYARADFVGETFNVRPPRYAKPSRYLSFETDTGRDARLTEPNYCGCDNRNQCRQLEPGIDPLTDEGCVEKLESVTETGAAVTAELALLGQDWQPVMHSNMWRPISDPKSGLDGWPELDYSWIDFDQEASELVAGSPATGTFHLMLDASESQSKLFLEGKFVVDKIDRDIATVVNLQDEKAEQYGTELCGEDVSQGD